MRTALISQEISTRSFNRSMPKGLSTIKSRNKKLTTQSTFGQHFLNKSLLIRKGISNLVTQRLNNTFYPPPTKTSMKIDEEKNDTLIIDQSQLSYDYHNFD